MAREILVRLRAPVRAAAALIANRIANLASDRGHRVPDVVLIEHVVVQLAAHEDPEPPVGFISLLQHRRDHELLAGVRVLSLGTARLRFFVPVRDAHDDSVGRFNRRRHRLECTPHHAIHVHPNRVPLLHELVP